MLHLREWGIVFLAAGLVLGGCDDRPREHSNPARGLYEPLYGYFSITADVTAEGRRMTIENIYECRRVPASIDRAAHYVVSSGGVTKRLPSGAGIMISVNTAAKCSGWATKPGRMPRVRGYWPLEYGAIPTIFWFDDVENPTVIEGYISASYNERADARVRFHGLQLKVLGRGSETPQPHTDPREEIPWLGRSREERIRWISYTVRVAPRQVWAHEEALIRRLNGITKTTDLAPIIEEIGDLDVETMRALGGRAIGGGRFGGYRPFRLPQSGFSERLLTANREALERIARRKSAFPAADGGWEASLSPNWPGDYVVFQPDHSNGERVIDVDGFRVRVDDLYRSNIHYDRETDQLFRVFMNRL